MGGTVGRSEHRMRRTSASPSSAPVQDSRSSARPHRAVTGAFACPPNRAQNQTACPRRSSVPLHSRPVARHRVARRRSQSGGRYRAGVARPGTTPRCRDPVAASSSASAAECRQEPRNETRSRGEALRTAESPVDGHEQGRIEIGDNRGGGRRPVAAGHANRCAPRDGQSGPTCPGAQRRRSRDRARR